MSDLRLKCSKFDFRPRLPQGPRPSGGAYALPQIPIAVVKGRPTSNGERRGWEGKGKGKEKGK